MRYCQKFSLAAICSVFLYSSVATEEVTSSMIIRVCWIWSIVFFAVAFDHRQRQAKTFEALEVLL